MDAEENSAYCETVVESRGEQCCETFVDAEENSSSVRLLLNAEENSAAVRHLWMQRRTVLL